MHDGISQGGLKRIGWRSQLTLGRCNQSLTRAWSSTRLQHQQWIQADNIRRCRLLSTTTSLWWTIQSQSVHEIFEVQSTDLVMLGISFARSLLFSCLLYVLPIHYQRRALGSVSLLLKEKLCFIIDVGLWMCTLSTRDDEVLRGQLKEEYWNTVLLNHWIDRSTFQAELHDQVWTSRFQNHLHHINRADQQATGLSLRDLDSRVWDVYASRSVMCPVRSHLKWICL